MNNTNKFKGLGIAGLVLFQVLPVAIILFHVYGFSERTDDAGWIEDAGTGCKYFTNTNFQNRHFTWTGDCCEGFAHGQGELMMWEGNRAFYKFTGTLTMGKSEGFGRLQFLMDGDLYEGQYKDSRPHGFGHFYNDDGDHYEGEYFDGQRSGFGTYWYPPESPELKFSGQWKAGQKNGAGTLYYRNGKEVAVYFEKDELLEKIKTGAAPVPPKNILITNDDGVEDMDRLTCLAEAVSSFAGMVVVAVPHQNKSGTSNTMLTTKQGFIKAKCLSVDTSRQIYIYEVQGYPADCVVLGAGMFEEKGKSIDLVISGINGGPNSGMEWFGSGTIGAARTAAMVKIPAIAFSGINGENENGENLLRLCRWVADVVQSPIINEIRPLEYLTVSIPENLGKIKGIKILERAITFNNPPFYLVSENAPAVAAGREYTYRLKPTENPSNVYKMPAEQDVFYYYQNYIVVVPMSVDENNSPALLRYQMHEHGMPLIRF
ncbi:MAG: 5'/3'-nucleotidase SurE [Bacteroidota bacterium]